MTSCKKSVTGDSSAALEIIPADATFVVSVDYENLVKKGQLDNLDNYAFLQKLQAEIADDMPEGDRELIFNFVKDPSSLGLNLKTFYLFGLSPETTRNGSLGVFIAFNVAKQSVFEESIKKIFDDENFEIENKGAFRKVKGDDAPLMWNEEVAVISSLPFEHSPDDLSFLFEKKSSVKDNEEFSEFINKQGDIKAWFKYDNLFKSIAASGLANSDQVPPAIFGKINYLASVNFENGEILFDYNAFPKSEVDRLNEKYPVLKKDFNDKLLEDFPEENFLLFKFAVNIKEYITLLGDLLQGNNPLEDLKIQNVTNAFAGDFVLNIHGFADGFIPVPLVGLGFTVTGKQGFEDILSLIPPGYLNKSGDIYIITLPHLPLVSIFIAEKDNRVIASNDRKQIEAFVGKGFDRSLKNSEILTKHKGSINFAYVNLDLSTYPLSIRGILNNLGKNSDKLVYILNNLHSVKAWHDDRYVSFCSFKFADPSKNSLQTLLEIIDRTSSTGDFE
jgi:hypothetical protein